jgi:hypothetical protein
MWIKWQNRAMPARSLATCHALGPAQPAAAAVRAHVALMGTFLNFSIKMDNFQPNKLSQRSVKISCGIKPYNA